ncbi:MAG TPA: twin-arginine translocase subunit TatC [Pirellulaceae bacterium]|nr:twin-arginine translocase subunit TatC [Pirellulaceae bacterium]
MAKHHDDDNFSGSTMSFGDHLEELRATLFRSVLGLMVGVGLGLAVADYVVAWIKEPLVASLEKFYVEKSISLLEAENGEGSVTPALKSFIAARQLVFEKHYIEVDELTRLQKLRDEYESHLPPPAAKPAADKPETADKPEAEKEEPEKPADIVPTVLGGEALPAPSSVLMVTRIWKPVQTVVKALNAQEVFMVWMKAALVAGAVISSPYIFLQIWNFVAAGLYPHEKKYVYLYLPFSLGLFLAGAALCFTFVIPQVLDWLLTFNKSLNIDPDPRINEWIGFALFLPLGFGISFQLPLVMLMLNRIGILSIEIYLSHWRISVLVIFVISMILTPADPVSMLFMAIPLTFLYFGGIGMCKWMPRGRNPFDAAYEP